MNISQQCGLSFRLDGQTHQGMLNIETAEVTGKLRYRGVIESVPLRGTFGGWADNITLALDFLNLAMQAEGADEIAFTCEQTK